MIVARYSLRCFALCIRLLHEEVIFVLFFLSAIIGRHPSSLPLLGNHRPTWVFILFCSSSCSSFFFLSLCRVSPVRSLPSRLCPWTLPSLSQKTATTPHQRWPCFPTAQASKSPSESAPTALSCPRNHRRRHHAPSIPLLTSRTSRTAPPSTSKPSLTPTSPSSSSSPHETPICGTTVWGCAYTWTGRGCKEASST